MISYRSHSLLIKLLHRLNYNTACTIVTIPCLLEYTICALAALCSLSPRRLFWLGFAAVGRGSPLWLSGWVCARPLTCVPRLPVHRQSLAQPPSRAISKRACVRRRWITQDAGGESNRHQTSTWSGKHVSRTFSLSDHIVGFARRRRSSSTRSSPAPAFFCFLCFLSWHQTWPLLLEEHLLLTMHLLSPSLLSICLGPLLSQQLRRRRRTQQVARLPQVGLVVTLFLLQALLNLRPQLPLSKLNPLLLPVPPLHPLHPDLLALPLSSRLRSLRSSRSSSSKV